jgi:DNA gyrase subunit A
MTIDNFKSQNRGGKGIKGMQTIDDDYITDLLMTSTHHHIMFITNMGRAYTLKAYEIPEAGRTARGTAVINLIQLQSEEKVQAIIPVKEFVEDKYLFMVTKHGIVKKTPLIEFGHMRKSGLQAITLKENDTVIEVKTVKDTRDLFLVTKKGMCIRFKASDVRKTGRTSMGVIGMDLKDGDEIIGMQMNTQGESLLLVTENGMGKRTPIEDFKIQKRAGKGVKCYKISAKTGELIGVKAVNDDNEVMLVTNDGIIIQFKVDEVSKIGRDTSGVKLMNTGKDQDVKVAKIAKVRENPEPASDINEEVENKENETNSETDSDNK